MAADKNLKDSGLEAGWIRELADILHETGLSEIEIEKNDIRLRVARQMAGGTIVSAAPAATPVEAAPIAQPAQAAAKEDHPGAVKSPMVGTAYLSASPGADGFVKIGESVTEGQTIMIVEAMKTMNPIAAPHAGVVKEILVSDAQPVEFGEALMIIE